MTPTERQIGRGSFGRIERIQLTDGQWVAKKIFHPIPELLPHININKFKERFRTEIEIQKGLPKSHFLPVLAEHVEAEATWFLMALGDTALSKKVSNWKRVLVDIVEGLEILHYRGYVHRDLNPKNILFHDGKWKLIDFGIALIRGAPEPRLKYLRSAWGSKNYAPPEQATSFGGVTPAADIYAFGCLLHDCVSEMPRIPFQRQKAEGKLGFIVERCTKEEPSERYQSVSALREDLCHEL